VVERLVLAGDGVPMRGDDGMLRRPREGCHCFFNLIFIAIWIHMLSLVWFFVLDFSLPFIGISSLWLINSS
jgi:hypothetical protein